MRRDTGPEVLLKLLEHMRTAWLTRREIADRSGLHRVTVKKWLDHMVERRMLVGRVRAGRFHAPAPQEFTVSSHWGGIA